MAFAFDSEQFNKETTPLRLGNFQVPRWSPSKPRPLAYRPDPKPICDNNGHFLPGAPRGTSKCFGHYTGTWDLPKKITRKIANEMAKEPPEGRFTDWLNLRVQRPKAAAAQDKRARMRYLEQCGKKLKKAKKPEDTDPKTFIETNNNDQEQQETEQETEIRQDENDEPNEKKDYDPLGILEKKEPVDSDGHGPYVPGSFTEPEKRHDSYDLLVKDAVEKIHGPQEDVTDRFWRKVQENAANNDTGSDNMKHKSRTPKLPQVNVAQNFQFAKNMHVGNLQHQPLPDTLGYRHLTKIAEHRDSDIIVKPYAIGWKGFGASGPTCCTKMRVHRPKTSDAGKEGETENGKLRPATSAPDLGGQSQKPLSLMDLAICWDFRPNNPRDEPRPPKHIDGSNGSKAPAVFTMVHTPKEEIEDTKPGHSQPIFTRNQVVEDYGRHPVPYFEKDMSKEKRKDSCDVQNCSQHNVYEKNSKVSSRRSSAQSLKPECDGVHGCGTPKGSSKSGSANSNKQCDGIHGCGTPEMSRRTSRDDKRPDKLEPIKVAWNSNNKPKSSYDINRNRCSLESYEKTPLAQGKLHQSSPNESLSRRSNKDTDSSNSKHKTCLSCNGTKMLPDTKPKEDYKSAFKAGNPNSVNSSNTNESKGVKMPKMRHPYTKKSYTIPTLVPPFSIWRDTNGSGYPEHWRLASVYQHAYKPPEQRRKPLISSVYQ